MREESSQYTAVAIVLHWAIAAAILGNLLLGWWMHGAIELPDSRAQAITAFQLHKSLGLTVLLLSLLRMGWRLAHRPPPLPAGMPAWEKLAARTTHWAFYGLMLALPLSGWLYVSAQWRGNAPLNVPTLWFGLFEVPHLFGLNEGSAEARRGLATDAFAAHWYLAWGAAALLALHVGAALKHHFLNRDAVLAQMLPLLQAGDGGSPAPPPDRRRSAVLALGFAGITLAAGGILFALFRNPAELASPAETPAAPLATTDAPPLTSPSTWTFAPAKGEVRFSGTHAGVGFRGRFTRWQAELRINPADLAQSTLTAQIETASATDGVPLHDETLPQAEWLDAAGHPHAVFRSTRITARDERHFTVEGTLNLKGRELAVVPPLELRLDSASALISGRFEIDRREADLGQESDPGAEYVSATIGVEVRAAGQRL